MIVKDETNENIERHKQKLGLTGDVYLLGVQIESLESHKRLIPTSTVTTIEEAEVERIAYEEELKREREELAKQFEEEQEEI